MGCVNLWEPAAREESMGVGEVSEFQLQPRDKIEETKETPVNIWSLS